LNLKPWSARTLYVYAHADLAQKYSVGLQEIFVSRCATRKKIIFSCPNEISICAGWEANYNFELARVFDYFFKTVAVVIANYILPKAKSSQVVHYSVFKQRIAIRYFVSNLIEYRVILRQGLLAITPKHCSAYKNVALGLLSLLVSRFVIGYITA
jgi:hypothetical protein